MRLALSILALAFSCGCAFAPHGSRATHEIYTYDEFGHLRRIEKWTDRSPGGGSTWLTDPKLQNGVICYTNSAVQAGGCVRILNGSIVVDPQAGQIIKDVGAGIGAGVGAGVKAAFPALP